MVGNCGILDNDKGCIDSCPIPSIADVIEQLAGCDNDTVVYIRRQLEGIEPEYIAVGENSQRLLHTATKPGKAENLGFIKKVLCSLSVGQLGIVLMLIDERMENNQGLF